MPYIRRTGAQNVAGAAIGRKVYAAVVKSDNSEGVAWVEQADVVGADEVISEAQYNTAVADIHAWNVANTPTVPPDPLDEEFEALQQLLGPDWEGSETAWAGLSAAQRDDHLRARTNALRRGVLYLYNLRQLDTSGME